MIKRQRAETDLYCYTVLLFFDCYVVSLVFVLDFSICVSVIRNGLPHDLWSTLSRHVTNYLQERSENIFYQKHFNFSALPTHVENICAKLL